MSSTDALVASPVLQVLGSAFRDIQPDTMNHLGTRQPPLHQHSRLHQLPLQEPPALSTLDPWSRTTRRDVV